MLAKVPVHEAAHGFRAGSLDLSATPRRTSARDVVVNLDLKDFFPTLGYRRVKGMFRGARLLRGGRHAARADLHRAGCRRGGARRPAATSSRKGQRRLPQGAPTSPAITNLLCRRLDRRLAGLAAKLGFTYTRYADDLTFSASGEAARADRNAARGGADHRRRRRLHRAPRQDARLRSVGRQEVTGVVVNERL